VEQHDEDEKRGGRIAAEHALALGDAIAAPRRTAVLGAILAAATTFTYSYHGLNWPLAIVVVWAVSELVLGRPRLTQLPIREFGVAGALACAVFAAATAPELGRFADWAQSSVAQSVGTGPTASYRLGAASGYEALGIWPSADFRVQPANVLRAGIYVAVALGAAVFAAVSYIVYERASVVLYPDFTAKTLAVAAPTVMLMITRALLTDLPGTRSWRRGHRPSSWRIVQLATAVVFIALASWSTALAFRGALIDPGAHDAELRELRPLVQGRSTLFLGKDFYAPWRLRGAKLSTHRVPAPVEGPTRGPRGETGRSRNGIRL
jgi:hypothetical protein